MTEPNNMPIIKPETVAPPSVSNLSVAPVGTGMFRATMQVIMGVRFSTDVLTESGVAHRMQYCAALASQPPDSPSIFRENMLGLFIARGTK